MIIYHFAHYCHHTVVMTINISYIDVIYRLYFHYAVCVIAFTCFIIMARAV